jgi:transposase
VTAARESLPTDLASAHALILAERTARVEAEARLAVARAEAANAQADLSSTEAFISHLKLEIEKLRRQLYGTRSERKARLLEQMELQLEGLEAAATEDESGGREGRGARTIRPGAYVGVTPICDDIWSLTSGAQLAQLSALG